MRHAKAWLGILVVVAIMIVLVGSFTFSTGETAWQEQGGIRLGIQKTSGPNFFSDIFDAIFAIVQPSVNVQPGTVVGFDSHEYMDCGLCDVYRYPTSIDGYRIKVFNSAGNLVADQFFQNGVGSTHMSCGNYANFYYQYTVPSGAATGNWRITLEVAVSPIWPALPECIVAQDEGTFTVGTSCANKDTTVEYCVDVNTRYYKPAGTCSVQYTNCDDVYGQGFKCQDGKCQQVEVCGDSICDDFENPYNCYVDCGSCGDTLCTGPETYQNCPQDCYYCGDGVCNAGEALGCGADCHVCGDGECYWYEQKGQAYACESDCFPAPPVQCPAIWGFIPNVPCLINKFFNDLLTSIANFFAPLIWIASIFGFIIVTLVSRKKLGGYVGKKWEWLIALFIGILAAAIIYMYFWVGLIFLIIYMIIINLVPIIGGARSVKRAVKG